jgi:hypothetical protein
MFHLELNLYTHLGKKNDKAKTILYKAHHTTDPALADIQLRELADINNDTFNWLNTLPKEKWMRSRMNFCSYETSTSSIAESFNSLTAEARKSSIIGLLSFIHQWHVNKWTERSMRDLSFRNITKYAAEKKVL